MRFRDLMTLRQPADVAAEARATEARILAPLDALVIEAREVVEHYRAAVPFAFDDRRDRRAGDQPGGEGNSPARIPAFELDHKRGANRGGAV